MRPAKWEELRDEVDGADDTGSGRGSTSSARYKGRGVELMLERSRCMYRGRLRDKVTISPLGKRHLVVFYEADNSESTSEMVSIIRGKGRSGQMMFGEDDTLPPLYGRLRIDNFGERIGGHFNRA